MQIKFIHANESDDSNQIADLVRKILPLFAGTRMDIAFSACISMAGTMTGVSPDPSTQKVFAARLRTAAETVEKLANATH